MVVFLQWQGGVYRGEFGSEPDEAAHYVTGLMVRDYITAGFPGNPMNFAKDYYDHYPKVALGHWPPGFYLIQAAWTLPFSASHTSVFLLMAFLAALIATVIFSALQQEFGRTLAVVGAITFCALPLVQAFSGAIMTEIPIALLALLAAICLGRFLERERTVDMVGFGLFASAAILTKQSALFLAALPVLGVLLTRKYHLLKRPAFWLAAVIVTVLCGPWTLATLKLASDGWTDEGWGWGFTGKAFPFYLLKLYTATGIALALLSALGLTVKLSASNSTDKKSGMWAALSALLVSVVLFHMVVPCGYEARHLIPALPAIVIFAVAGADWLAAKLICRGLQPRFAITLVFGVATLAFLAETFQIPQKGYQGFGTVAAALLQNPDAKQSIFLVSSDARGEGMFVSELALREPRPGHIIRRASKELASSSWSGGGYQSKFTDERTLVNALKQRHVGYVVLDQSVSGRLRRDYHDLLFRAVTGSNSSTFVLEGRFPILRASVWQTNGLSIYRVKSD